MGLFKRVASAATGAGVGGLLSGPAGMFGGGLLGGTGGFGGIKDFLLGKQQTTGFIGADPIMGDIREAQKKAIKTGEKGLAEIEKVLDRPSESIVSQAVTAKEKGLVQSAKDARRQAQELMARRGLMGTSLGIGQQRAITKDLGEQLSGLRASIPAMQRAQALSDAQARMAAGTGLFGGLGGMTGMVTRDVPGTTGRSGGLLGYTSALAPAIGTIGGLFAGKPGAGAAIGQGVGQSAGAFQRMS